MGFIWFMWLVRGLRCLWAGAYVLGDCVKAWWAFYAVLFCVLPGGLVDVFLSLSESVKKSIKI